MRGWWSDLGACEEPDGDESARDAFGIPPRRRTARFEHSDGEGVIAPTGRLRPGYVRIAGVVRGEVKVALLELLLERDLPSLSQAVGLALEEWCTLRQSGALHLTGNVAEGDDRP
jgi:hypothetical protein